MAGSKPNRKTHIILENATYRRQLSVVLLKLADISGLSSGKQSLIYLYTDSNNLSLVQHDDRSLTLEVGIQKGGTHSFSSFGDERWVIEYQRGDIRVYRNKSSYEETIDHPEFRDSMRRIIKMCAGWYSLFRTETQK